MGPPPTKQLAWNEPPSAAENSVDTGPNCVAQQDSTTLLNSVDRPPGATLLPPGTRSR